MSSDREHRCTVSECMRTIKFFPFLGCRHPCRCCRHLAGKCLRSLQTLWIWICTNAHTHTSCIHGKLAERVWARRREHTRHEDNKKKGHCVCVEASERRTHTISFTDRELMWCDVNSVYYPVDSWISSKRHEKLVNFNVSSGGCGDGDGVRRALACSDFSRWILIKSIFRFEWVWQLTHGMLL